MAVGGGPNSLALGGQLAKDERIGNHVIDGVTLETVNIQSLN